MSDINPQMVSSVRIVSCVLSKHPFTPPLLLIIAALRDYNVKNECRKGPSFAFKKRIPFLQCTRVPFDLCVRWKHSAQHENSSPHPLLIRNAVTFAICLFNVIHFEFRGVSDTLMYATTTLHKCRIIFLIYSLKIKPVPKPQAVIKANVWAEGDDC